MKADEIRRLRELLELTQEKFAQLIGVNRVTLAKWETGDHQPRGLYLKALQQLAAKVRGGRSRRKT